MVKQTMDQSTSSPSSSVKDDSDHESEHVPEKEKEGSGSHSLKGQVNHLFAGAKRRYDEFIEKGKRKLGFYHPDVTENDRFLMSFLIYFMFLFMVVFIADYGAQKIYEDSNSLESLQEAEAEIVYRVQKDYFDMPVTLNESSKTLWYDTSAEWRGHTMSKDDRIGGFGLQIDSVCTGFHEIVFLSVLVLGFRGVPVKLRIKWVIILDIIVFVENLFRIFALYPMAMYWGRDFEAWFHHYWWHYGQYLFIMSLFVLWFFLVARKYVNADEYTEMMDSKMKASRLNENDSVDTKKLKSDDRTENRTVDKEIMSNDTEESKNAGVEKSGNGDQNDDIHDE